ncbi:MAG: glycosyltransferase family A protein, partial [Patescibacteria group bacterium]
MEKKEIKISVCIPCYNQGEFIAEAIESVLAQSFRPYEIWVCNDGSQDETRYIANQYTEVKYIEQVNKGLASARNTGLMNMTGDYFYPLDADDMMLENCLEKITETIEKNPDADVIAPSFKEFGVRDTTITLMKEPKLEDFRLANRIGYFSAIKKEALLEVGGYSPKMVFGYEDYHLWINLLSRGKKIVTLQDV